MTVNGKPRAAYTATVSPTDGRTAVDVAYTADRRFGLRYLPHARLAARYRDDALAVQGFAVVERDTHLTCE